MNREDLLKKSVDRGVADETSIGTVSHLFYVYLLSALQRGQRVEIPNFGTFGTRVVGVKRARKVPYFEPEKELADKVNDRYSELKYLVLGKYELIAALGEEEYTGKEAPHDTIIDHIGKEVLVDTHRDVTIEEYERSLAASKSVKTTEEKPLMPKLNLKDEGMEPETTPVEDEQPTAPPPTLRTTGMGGSGPSPLIQVLIAVVVLGALTFALNYFDVIHLWGKKAPAVVEALPEAEISTQAPETPTAATITPETPTPIPTPPSKVETPNLGVPASSAGGRYTIQVSSWMTPSKANEEVNRLSTAGFDAFVEDGNVSGEKWYRVRVGRYTTEKEAAAAASQLQQMLENGIWVARVGS
jgi:septal ring-binding cell division protein DamX/nucleoid DNA-binding protein